MMAKPAWACFLSAIVLTFICAGIYAFIERADVAKATLSEVETIIGVDANPAGNSGTSLGSINGCIRVSHNDTFSIDLIVQDVANLKSFDGTFRFDGSILEVTGVDVVGPVGSRYFLATAPESDIESHPDPVPNSSGSFLINAVDRANAPESGKGTLARLQIRAKAAGTSKANFNLRPDFATSGVQLFDQAGNAIPPIDEYNNFDGTILDAQIAVDVPCPAACEPDVDTDSDGFNDDVECYLPTDQLDACPNNPSHDAWPLDMNMDTFVTMVDVNRYAGRLGSTGGPPPSPAWLKRLDLNMDNFITMVDVNKYAGKLGSKCT